MAATDADTTPDYDAHQSAFHEAFAADLERILDALPLPAQARVIDVPCGNGFYSRRLAARLGDGGHLDAVDTCTTYLRQTRERVADLTAGVTVDVRQADAYHLPFAAATFDLVWCAQSLISLDPAAAVQEMYRVVKADGLVAILEADEFHHVLLAWPAELEAALPQAVHAASVSRFGSGLKFSPTRHLRRLLRQSGFPSVRRKTYSLGRTVPYDGPTAAFLARHFAYLRSFAYPHLPAPQRATFDRFTDPDAELSLYRQADSDIVCLNAVYLARPQVVKKAGRRFAPARSRADVPNDRRSPLRS